MNAGFLRRGRKTYHDLVSAIIRDDYSSELSVNVPSWFVLLNGKIWAKKQKYYRVFASILRITVPIYCEFLPVLHSLTGNNQSFTEENSPGFFAVYLGKSPFGPR